MLIIDNYDSFTYNIVQYLQILSLNPIVITNDEMNLERIKQLSFSRILLSPGWGNPENSGVTMDVIDYYQDRVPILGVCLGMQCIAKYFGAKIVKLNEPYHGKNSKIFYDEGFKLFQNMPQGFSATRYHSLVVDAPKDNPMINITARTDDGLPMALKIRNKKIYGVQFHPEAYLTEDGIQIFKNFINM